MKKQLTPMDIERLMQAVNNAQAKDEKMLEEIRTARREYLHRHIQGMNQNDNIDVVMDWIRDAVNKWGTLGFTALLTMMVLDGLGGNLQRTA